MKRGSMVVDLHGVCIGNVWTVGVRAEVQLCTWCVIGRQGWVRRSKPYVQKSTSSHPSA